VASNAEGKGIHVVNDHTKYKEWEFVYDLKNDKSALGAGAGALQQQLQQQQNGATPGTGPLTPTQTPTPPPAPTVNQ
jgi:thiamine monophosphate synthase